MREIIYNKLVRDNIPEIIKANNKEPIIYMAEIEETKTLLFQKLFEELNEFKETPNEEELADMLEVIEGIGNLYQLNMNQVYQKKEVKRKERGGFQKRIVLVKVIEK